MARKNKIQTTGQLRIIGGNWRGRKLSFPELAGLRPTPDRVRETLFNWLQGQLGGACCLDLFAGSGALGFEAASRGAASVDMIEIDRHAFSVLQQNKIHLSANACELFNTTAQQFLNTVKTRYDIVFIDPPYQADLWSEVATLLMQRQLLKPYGLIYLETPAKSALPELPDSWIQIKDKRAGDVRYCLFKFGQEHALSE